MPDELTLLARAKINLSLEIVGKRLDGFHDLVSVVQEVSLADTLRVSPGRDIALECRDPSISGDDNLALRAARLTAEYFDVTPGCRITLDKCIPVAAGLGGGSSDAAAALRAVNALWQTGARCDDLLELAQQLGSDVPFFLYGGTALVEGRGEKVQPLHHPSPDWLVLANPGFPVRTAHIFHALDRTEWSDGSVTRRLAHDLEAGRPMQLGVNGLQRTLFQLYPSVLGCFRESEALAPGRTIISGSGPTVVSLFDSRSAAEEGAEVLRRRGFWSAAVRTHQPRSEETPCR